MAGGWGGGHLGWSCASARTDGPDDEGGEDGPKASVGSIWEYYTKLTTTPVVEAEFRVQSFNEQNNSKPTKLAL